MTSTPTGPGARREASAPQAPGAGSRPTASSPHPRLASADPGPLSVVTEEIHFTSGVW